MHSELVCVYLPVHAASELYAYPNYFIYSYAYTLGAKALTCILNNFQIVFLGMSQFLHGISDEMKQRHREHLFTVSRNNLIDVANR